MAPVTLRHEPKVRGVLAIGAARLWQSLAARWIVCDFPGAQKNKAADVVYRQRPCLAPDIEIGLRHPVNYSLPWNRMAECEAVHKAELKLGLAALPTKKPANRPARSRDLCSALARLALLATGAAVNLLAVRFAHRRRRTPTSVHWQRIAAGRRSIPSGCRPVRRAFWCRPAGRRAAAAPSATGPAPPAAGRSIPAGWPPSPWSFRRAVRMPARRGPAAAGRTRHGRAPARCRYRRATSRLSRCRAP